MSTARSDDATTPPVGARLAEELKLTDDDLADMSPDELQRASAELKEVAAVLDEVDGA